ncbi:MAG: 30S ribosomal protein S13 [Patescibacteria group bacterium]
MAARIAGVTLPQNKRIEVALTYIFGVGPTRARTILTEAKVDPDKRAEKLDQSEVNALRDIIENKYKVEGGLRRDILLNIKRLKETNSYRGIRHLKGLPVHGQRTKTNSRSVRGNVRRTMGSGRRKSADKT